MITRPMMISDLNQFMNAMRKQERISYILPTIHIDSGKVTGILIKFYNGDSVEFNKSYSSDSLLDQLNAYFGLYIGSR